MKHYELESLLKSFLLFFILMLSLYLLLEWQSYKEQHRQLDRTIYSEMQIFSYKPLSGEFDVSFVPHEENIQSTKEIHKEELDPYALFDIPGSKSYLMKVSLVQKKYQERLGVLKEKIYSHVSLYIFFILVIAVLLAYYALYPFKKALQVNEEFVRDILHDINTPLSSLLVNLNILKRRFGNDRGFDRMANNVETIENLQSNLKSFLHRQPQVCEKFSLYTILHGRIEYFSVLYPSVSFLIEMDKSIMLNTNHEAFVRIIDNLLSNAGKYNKKNGKVQIAVEEDILQIEDTGIGIKNTDRVFERYYKEGERALGIGLHVVKKLTEELDIDISLESRLGKGTKVFLNLSEVID
ncbi:MAG: HAMP domain-containing histidine kinase [Sulfurovum sp.]|nr:HAMP domain-containing histidine kinase [Sulfurovum sp.]